MFFYLLLQPLAALISLPSNPEVLRFMVIGDWGATRGKPTDFQNQKLVGKAMATLADQEQTDFIVSLGARDSLTG